MVAKKSDSSSILFVCLGNICRSPLAEAAMRSHAENEGVNMIIDSAGTGRWHVGRPPDPGSVAIAAAAGIDITAQRARQVMPSDFARFDRIVALDRDNLAELQRIQPAGAKASLSLLLDYHPHESRRDVPDPYGGNAGAFAEVWQLVDEATAALLARLGA